MVIHSVKLSKFNNQIQFGFDSNLSLGTHAPSMNLFYKKKIILSRCLILLIFLWTFTHRAVLF